MVMEQHLGIPRVHLFLSSFFFGVFAAPLFALLWLAVPVLRDFPVGDDSPHAVGLPLGFLLGVAGGLWINKLKVSRVVPLVCGIPYLFVSLVYFMGARQKANQMDGWSGLGAVFEALSWLHVVVSAVGLCLAGMCSMLGWRKLGIRLK